MTSLQDCFLEDNTKGHNHKFPEELLNILVALLILMVLVVTLGSKKVLVVFYLIQVIIWSDIKVYFVLLSTVDFISVHQTQQRKSIIILSL